MKKPLLGLTYFLLAVLLATTAQAQNDDWYFAAAAVHTDDDGDRLLDDSVAGGQFSLGRAVSEHISLEGMVGYSDIDGFPGQKHLDISVNVLGIFNRDSAFSPYVLGGVGYLGTELENAGDENGVSTTLGVGVLWRLGRSSVSIRAEYRGRRVSANDNVLADRIATLGLQFTFGARAKTVFDGDEDGVLDDMDRCPRTARGVVVDRTGCEVDSDGDGVPNGADACHNTPAGTQVDAYGCPLDGDRDGVSDDKDQCPHTFAGAAVNANGCEKDDDGDRVVNHVDRCPNTRAGVRVDINGCEITDVIQLPGVNFVSGSDRLLPGAAQVLTNAAATLKKHADLVIEVAGHTDSDGSAANNQGLSERRAITVRDFLVNAGANPANLSAKGYGESRPIADNATAQGKAINRRVELRIRNR
ncbi:MAG: OmpA family protein [Gammaproteobacteria bacterium]|nr:OmpA family protein [Gammaproteobacteria bacterium]